MSAVAVTAATGIGAPGGVRPLLEIEGLVKHYDLRRGLRRLIEPAEGHTVRALDGVDLALVRGETLGVIGESGSGKTTLGRCALGLVEPTAGTVRFDGMDLARLDPATAKALRRRMQIVFQDPYASLNPRRTVERIVGLGLAVHERLDRAAARARILAMLERVGLGAAHLDRYPHQFSGGQRQRIGIARALVLRPDFVVCDEPVSALDVSIQAQILALLRELKEELGLTYLFIAHDLAVVAHLSDRVAVLYLGKLVELGPTRAVLKEPAHPYTRALLAAVPRLDGRRDRGAGRLAGEPPSPVRPPAGCRFHPRCPYALPVCRVREPELSEVAPRHRAACHLHREAA